MKFMRRTAGYAEWDQKRNEDVLYKLKIILQSELSANRTSINGTSNDGRKI
jgi:hypothetical protein